MCDTVFTLQSLLGAHFDQHVGNHKVSVFKCPDCSMLYAQKQLMLDHIKVHLIYSILQKKSFSYTSTMIYLPYMKKYML